jgi:hypothetical protein
VASREHPRQDISLDEFLEKGQSKNSGFFFVATLALSLFIFFLPSNIVFVSWTPKTQVRDPTGVIAGSLRSSYLQRSAQAQSSPPKLTLTGVQLPAAISNYGQTFLILSSNLSPGTDDLFR